MLQSSVYTRSACPTGYSSSPKISDGFLFANRYRNAATTIPARPRPEAERQFRARRHSQKKRQTHGCGRAVLLAGFGTRFFVVAFGAFLAAGSADLWGFVAFAEGLVLGGTASVIVVSLVVILVSPYIDDADDTFITPIEEESDAELLKTGSY